MAYWVDDGLDTSPEAVRAGTAAMGLYLLCGVWISRAISQGYITEPVIPAEVARRYGTREWAQRLVDVGLWSAEAAAGYRDVRYHTGGGRPGRTPELNPTADKIAERRMLNARRQALFRDPALREAVRARDGDFCRYCHVQVRWNDRKGPRGGTYDHIDPYGPNSYDNIVVCCRSCNSRKKNRTPEQAGMKLLDPYLVTNQVRSKSRSGSASPPSLPPLKGEGGRAPAQAGAARPPDPRRCRDCANRLDSPYHRNVCQTGPRTIDDPQETTR